MARVVGAEGVGDGVAFAAGDGLAAGELLGLAAGEGDFFVAAKAASGADKARAVTHARRNCSLFFMVSFWVEESSLIELESRKQW
jgi:hypothetical protein